ncbi:hypothetical protein [Polyangium sp. 15x6]|uniref:hypothetical protein n=1 Tax=Polyangium sp. 15x6 TaxID=3042687 RepID=UPI00249C710B|nr:hypothetical protein [Polyangium sp. 15x6]MDI3283674.1 hypothetical protein [Polyangium sp. 15x6]
MRAVQARILGAGLPLGVTTPKELRDRIRTRLLRASNQERIRTPLQGIHRWVNEGPGDKRYERVITGGIKDFARRPESARIKRDDGAWLHFTMTVRWDGKSALEMLAYDFELVFPTGHVPPFVRLDLNEPGHHNEAIGLRSHIHPGNDDLQLPAPLMTPEELLDLFLGDELRPRDKDKPRT